MLTFIGLAIGVSGSLGVTRLMASLLYGVSARDPMTMAAVATVLAMVALLACYIPAERATRIDPLLALGRTRESAFSCYGAVAAR